MQFTALESYIKSKVTEVSHTLKNCDVVVDADSFFRDTYNNSGCQFIFGPDCDRYADFLINKLRIFLDSSIKCCFIFKGVTKMELDKRQEKHQKIIDKRSSVECCKRNVDNFDPIFVSNVQKQVLEEMNIRYFICEALSFDAIVGVARKFKCPVITNKTIYCLLGVSCIPTNSLNYDKATKEINCFVYDKELVRSTIGVFKEMPILLTALNESGKYFNTLLAIIGILSKSVPHTIQWAKQQKENNIKCVIQKLNENERKTFKETYENFQRLILYPSHHMAAQYFRRVKPFGIFKDNKKWFSKGICSGRFAVPYINLKKYGVVSGSEYMFDKDQPDAVLAAIDIISYTHCLLTNSQCSDLTFVGRKYDSIKTWDISKCFEKEISNRDIFNFKSIRLRVHSDIFLEFLEEVLPGYETSQFMCVPQSCLLLIWSLVYYIHINNKEFVDEAYCIILSFIILDQVSQGIDFYEKTNDRTKSLFMPEDKDCIEMYEGLQFLFNKTNINNLNVSTMHKFCEFQHCLEYMNYLNKMCGETSIPCTVYHKTYNSTFIYNTLMFMKNKNHLMDFLETKFRENTIFKVYKNIVSQFEACLNAVKTHSKIGTVFNYVLH